VGSVNLWLTQGRARIAAIAVAAGAIGMVLLFTGYCQFGITMRPYIDH
jgi:hypothetical protein